MYARASLSGQNRDRRVAGAGSSPALSPSKKTVLWQRLRKYDQHIAELECRLAFMRAHNFMRGDIAKLEQQRAAVDEKRRLVRRKLQGY